MKKEEAIILCIFITILTMFLGEGAYLLGFTPLSLVNIIDTYLNVGVYWGIIIVAADIFVMSILALLVVNLFYKAFNRIAKYVIISAIIFVLVNLLLSFLPLEMEKMTFASQICLFSVIVTSNTTFLYSIFYQNLIKYKG